MLIGQIIPSGFGDNDFQIIAVNDHGPVFGRIALLDTGDEVLGEAHAWWAYAVILRMVYWETEPSPDAL